MWVPWLVLAMALTLTGVATLAAIRYVAAADNALLFALLQLGLPLFAPAAAPDTLRHLPGGEAMLPTWQALGLSSVILVPLKARDQLLGVLALAGEGRIVAVTAKPGQGVVEISVQDQGIGISGERVGQIFDMFERAVFARHYGGLGLGLFIVRRIIEAMGGSIRVAGQLGQGSTFVVTLPLATSCDALAG